ncbi:uncharacterized protein TTMY_1211 [Thermus thermophilus]|uniref:hypothetical protein n=1 Tax=Thermus thermophilus TaxID=274 RepID=UPI00090A580B|nr:hypothetical protein [Thermus thermophilus]BAW01605.1 uncharacterized protein TTMY_1211 [Thermus thermophilus]
MLKEGPGKELLEGVATLLRMDPMSYVAFGPYWWWIKRWLQEAYGEDSPVQGDADDPVAREHLAAYWKGDWKKLWRAAIRHYQQKVAWGERYEPHSYMPPHEEAYVVNDPDMVPPSLPRMR